MDSICTVVGHSVCEAPSNQEPSGHSLKVHLEIGHENNKNNIKSPSKYTPSKHYKGMIFPPPNSEEADKVSSYIEEKLSIHRERRSKKDIRYTERKRRSHNPVSLCLSGDNLYAIPKRSELHDGEDFEQSDNKRKNYKKCTYRVDTNGLINPPSSHNSLSPALSGSDTPMSLDEADSSDHKKSSNHRNNTCKVEIDDNYKIRLFHSCSCHYKLKERLKSTTCEGRDNQESNLCKQIKMSARKHFTEYDLDRRSYHSSSTKSSTSSSSGPASRGDQNRTEQVLINKKSIHEVPSSKKLTNMKDTSQGENIRPAVWPGECIRGRTSTNENIRATNVTTESLCFCKRMLGLDYPCNHDNTVLRHTHKHEHHHYHHYISNGAH